MQTEERLIVGYGRLAEFLTNNGFPTSKSTMSKYCSPAVDTGPPVAAYWGKLASFRPSQVLTWARARLKPADIVRSKLAASGGAGAAAKSLAGPQRKRAGGAVNGPPISAEAANLPRTPPPESRAASPARCQPRQIENVLIPK
jgi:hypothetical protein